MSVLEIRMFGDPVLREPAEPVESFDDELRALVADMMETMYAAEGVGLAGPQVGVARRVFVYDVREPEHPPGAIVNPRVVAREGSTKEEEGCLSVPGLTALVERAERVVVEGLDPDGREVRVEADGLLSRCLQHEIDHLDGILFLDRVSPIQRRMLLKKWSKMEDPEPTGAL